ncbi:Male sterility protein [Popillia japonica]|uniref:Fatty acyl-CoA reductase n=1 Tax=Popillia japonica TaxID=7064 RepID=A0AAW1MFM0_POPJA
MLMDMINRSKEKRRRLLGQEYQGLKNVNGYDSFENSRKARKLGIRLLQGYPNTYTFTKSVAEEVVKNEMGTLPIAIVRPSIVISTYKEPLSGWVDNTNGPTFVVKYVMLGVLRTLYAGPRLVMDLIPADIVTNLIIVSALEAKIFNEPMKVVPSLNCRFLIVLVGHRILSDGIGLGIFSNQTLPANILDFILKCTGRKPKYVDLAKRMGRFYSVVEDFVKREWDFRNANTQNLWRKINSVDKELFNFDSASFNWNDVFLSYIKGVRMYMLKDPMDTLPRARRKALRLKIIYYTVPISIFLLFYKFCTLIG